MAKTIANKADCRTCVNAGKETNYMCFCSVLQRFSAVGIHICVHYKKRG